MEPRVSVPTAMTKILARLSTPETPLVAGVAGYFYHYRKCPPNPWVQYAAVQRIKSYDALESRIKRLQGTQNIIIANEAFLPNGQLKRSPIQQLMGNNWIVYVADLVKVQCPDSKLWLCDFRPSNLLMWQGIYRYLDQAQPTIQGIGLQLHIEANHLSPQGWHNLRHSPTAIGYIIDQAKTRGYATAFSEVTVWDDDDYQRDKTYGNICNQAHALGCEWLTLWSPTPLDNWHWNLKVHTKSHLWNTDGTRILS